MHNIYITTTLSRKYPITMLLTKVKYSDTERYKLTLEEAKQLRDMLNSAVNIESMKGYTKKVVTRLKEEHGHLGIEEILKEDDNEN